MCRQVEKGLLCAEVGIRATHCFNPAHILNRDLQSDIWRERYGALALCWLPAQGQIPFRARDVGLSTRYDVQQKPVAYFLISLAQKQNQTAESV